jgi:hypothetical protein
VTRALSVTHAHPPTKHARRDGAKFAHLQRQSGRRGRDLVAVLTASHEGLPQPRLGHVLHLGGTVRSAAHPHCVGYKSGYLSEASPRATGSTVLSHLHGMHRVLSRLCCCNGVRGAVRPQALQGDRARQELAAKRLFPCQYQRVRLLAGGAADAPRVNSPLAAQYLSLPQLPQHLTQHQLRAEQLTSSHLVSMSIRALNGGTCAAGTGTGSTSHGATSRKNLE